jgi:hypothetical protein
MLTRNKIKKLLLGLASLLCIAGSSLPALAQSDGGNQGLNIEISPLPINLNVKPGTTVTSDLRLRNSGNTAENLKVSLKTFDAVGPDGHIVLHDPSPADDFVNWVSFSETEFEVAAGQWQTVKMTVSPPKSAAYGYYYAVQFQLANPPKPKPGTTGIQGAVALFVLLNAEAPGASRDIRVTSFKAEHSTYEFLPVNFQVALRNTGNVHTAPHGNIFIKRGGHQVAALAVNQTEGNVLPKSNRIFNASWSDGFPAYVPQTDGAGNPIKDKNGNVKTRLDWDFSKVAKLRFGHYTANLLLIYNDGQRDIPITGTLSFWVIPWRLLAIIAFIILLIIGLAIYAAVLRHRLKGSGKNIKARRND